MWVKTVRQGNCYHCAQACVSAVSLAHGLPMVDVGTLLPGTPHDGTNPQSIEAAFRIHGFNVIAGTLSVADLRHFTRTERPVICLVQHEDGEGHYVVVDSIKRNWVQVMDPASGRYATKLPSWVDSWVDVDRYGVRYVRWGLVAYPSLTVSPTLRTAR